LFKPISSTAVVNLSVTNHCMEIIEAGTYFVASRQLCM